MNKEKLLNLTKFCSFLRKAILISTTNAGSGHPTSCLSAVELMAVLFRFFFRYKKEDPEYVLNDRLIFSKGHAAPLLYALWSAAGVVDKKELLNLRKKQSFLEGHPTFRFRYAEAATGSLGQGLGIGLGMAEGINLYLKENNLSLTHKPKVYVLLGDSEIAEGSVWEAFSLASYRKIDNLVAIIDLNRLGQSRETMWDWRVEELKKKISSFGWEVEVLEDGHNLTEIYKVYSELKEQKRPVAIVAKTKKGKGISFLEDKEGWHGKALNKEQLEAALKELGEIDWNYSFDLLQPEEVMIRRKKKNFMIPEFPIQPKSAGNMRKICGKSLAFFLKKGCEDIVVLDAEVSNSTYTQDFEKDFPDRFFECFIAEQNMVSVALGLQRMGFKPFSATFAAFFSRAFDQIRMAQYSKANLVFIGTHAGASVGPDGASQMGMEDIALFRSLLNSFVFAASDSVSAAKLLRLAYLLDGIVYLRFLRVDTPQIYTGEEEFVVGGFHLIKKEQNPDIALLAHGIMVHIGKKVAEILEKEGYKVMLIDLYSIKPLNSKGLSSLLVGAKNIFVLEDHYPFGGAFEAVCSALPSLRVLGITASEIPHSAPESEVLETVGLSAEQVVERILTSLSGKNDLK